MSARSLRPLLALAVLLLVGCYQHHYLVRGEGVQLYATPNGEQPLATLPRFHHEPLAEPPPEKGFVRLRFGELEGYVDRGGLLLFDYLDPVFDEGRDQREEIQRQLRIAQVEAYGKDWSADLAQAVREGRVIQGMTPRQVEVSWGWPLQVQPSPDGAQRWVYERTGTQVVHDYFQGLDCYGPVPLLQPSWSQRVVVRYERYLERSVVTIGPGGRVVAIEVTRTRI